MSSRTARTRTFSIDSNITPFYVSDATNTLWGRPEGGSGTAREYDLSGNPTGNTVAVSGNSNQRDGAYNAVDTAFTINNASPNSTVRFYDNGFANERQGFSFSNAPESFGVGLTFDTRAGTLWATNDVPGNTIRQLDLVGNTISTFTIPNQFGQGRPGPIAYEYATDSLWFLNEGGNVLSNWSKNGSLIQSFNVNIGSHRYSMEFASIVPAPGAAAVLGLGGLAAARRRRA